MKKVDQVEKVNLQKITDAATQFREAGKNAGDHTASLKSSTDALGSGVWAGPAADEFFKYVRQVRDAGTKVQTHLEDVAKDLDTLQTNLAEIKRKVSDKQNSAETAVNQRNTKAETAMQDRAGRHKRARPTRRQARRRARTPRRSSTRPRRTSTPSPPASTPTWPACRPRPTPRSRRRRS